MLVVVVVVVVVIVVVVVVVVSRFVLVGEIVVEEGLVERFELEIQLEKGSFGYSSVDIQQCNQANQSMFWICKWM